MAQFDQIPSQERIVDTMIELTRAAPCHRLIVAGSDALNVYLSLHQRGFSRAVTMATCRFPCSQHDVALIAGEHSVQALEALLVRVLPFLKTSAAVAVRLGSGGQLDGGKLQSLLERTGFRVEVGSRCESGFVLSARRRECGHLANAA